jgi:hypothetical protein
MLIYILGVIHLIHAPLLILYPYFINNNKIYIIYFYLMLLSYTFTNKSCPISYYAKKITNNTNLYPEMDIFISNKYIIKLYFTITTIIYSYTLYIINNNYYINNIEFIIIIIYFMNNNYYYQELVKYYCLIKIFLIIKFCSHYRKTSMC